MDGEYIRAPTELTKKLLNRDVNINKFHGYENEDINRWFEKLELVLDSKGIRLDVPAARTQLINNLAGPAETFMFEWPPDERRNYNALKQALVKRYSTKDRVCPSDSEGELHDTHTPDLPQTIVSVQPILH